MDEKVVTANEAAKITERSYRTILAWIKKGILEEVRVEKKKGSPIYVKYYSIPTFLRMRYEHKTENPNDY